MNSVYLTQYTRMTPTLKIERTIAIPNHYSITIGDWAGSVQFIMSRDDFVVLADQWQYELHSAWRDAYDTLGEVEAHAADDTIADLVQGADQGGKQ